MDELGYLEFAGKLTMRYFGASMHLCCQYLSLWLGIPLHLSKSVIMRTGHTRSLHLIFLEHV